MASRRKIENRGARPATVRILSTWPFPGTRGKWYHRSGRGNLGECRNWWPFQGFEPKIYTPDRMAPASGTGCPGRGGTTERWSAYVSACFGFLGLLIEWEFVAVWRGTFELRNGPLRTWHIIRYLLNFMGVFSSIATYVRISCATFAFRWRTFSSPNIRDRWSSNLTARDEQVHLAHCFSLSNHLISYATQFLGCFFIKYRTCSSFVRHFRVLLAHVFSFLLALT